MNRSKLFAVAALLAATGLVACNGTSSSSSTFVDSSTSSSSHSSSSSSSTIENSIDNPYTIAEFIEQGSDLNSGDTSTERWYVAGTITEISDPFFGEMTIQDDTGSIGAYGTYSADGEDRYGVLPDDEKPVAGDDVVLYATLKNFNGNFEINSGWIVAFTDNTVDDDIEYTEMTNLEFRQAEDGAYAQLTGVVAQLTYNASRIANGFILVDSTDSVYVYDMSVANQVQIGNTVTVTGTKDMFVASNAASSAAAVGYEGCLELTDCSLVSNDNGNTAFDTSWIEETTVKKIVDTDFSENITGRIYKANVYITRYEQESSDYVNYYLNDLDGTTGSYVYTQASGADFEWLDAYEGHIVSMYFTALNANTSSSGALWRFLPIKVIEDNVTFDLSRVPWFAVEYYGLNQLASSYTTDPAVVMTTEVSSELLHFSGAKLSFESSNTDVAYFSENEGVTTFHTGTEYGTATITVTGTYKEYEAYSDTFEVTYREPVVYELTTIPDAIAMDVQDTDTDEPIYLQGVVGPSLINQPGFILITEEGTIAVKCTDYDIVAALSLGNTVIVEGYRDLWHSKNAEYGEIVISNATIVENDSLYTDYSTASFKTDTITNISAQDVTNSLVTTQAYFSEATITSSGGMYSTYYINDPDNTETGIQLYSSSAAQYSWIADYANNDETYNIQMIPVNFNSKNYVRGLLMAIEVDGEWIYNTYNFA